jgi:catechol 2,3-dioxygenase-like lactoylglutathione lyase family enzyme
MILGLRTAAYFVTDLEKATRWYTEVLGFDPYFSEPFYVGFNVGEGIKVASVNDPFSNIFGIIENPLFQLPTQN